MTLEDQSLPSQKAEAVFLRPQEWTIPAGQRQWNWGGAAISVCGQLPWWGRMGSAVTTWPRGESTPAVTVPEGKFRCWLG
jgi:hypothetical protein